MSELLFGASCFLGGAICAVVIPKFFLWTADLVAKAKKTRDRLND